MAVVAAEVPNDLPPVVQIKIVLMSVITSRLAQRFNEATDANDWRHGRGALQHASDLLEMDASDVSRLRAGAHQRFSLDALINLCTKIGVEITITAR